MKEKTFFKQKNLLSENNIVFEERTCYEKFMILLSKPYCLFICKKITFYSDGI